MNEYQLICDYKDNDSLRQSLNQLTLETFGFSFEAWYQRGYWADQCVPYAYIHHGAVIANVMANKMDLILNGERRKAIQVGTVVTRPEYRHQGLSAELMNKVLESYQKDYDLFYLFANHTVLDFYPKFGFERVEMCGFELETLTQAGGPRGIRKLDIDNTDDFNLIYRMAKQRRPISQVFGAENAQNLFMFYCINVFPDDIYFFEPEGIMIIAHRENEVMHLYDIVNEKDFDFQRILPRLLEEGVERVVFHFTPEQLKIDARQYPCEHDDVLFVKGAFPIQRSFLASTTSHT